jgi:putative SOS response-associated peptidase YedK
MCGRIAQWRRWERLAERYAASFEEVSEHRDIRIRFNLAPTQLAFVVLEDDGRRVLDWLRWGLIPSWAKDPGIGSSMINARVETVATSTAYRGPYRTQRCLIPADGFYEWRTTGGSKTPFYISRTDGEPLSLAGLWSAWTDPQSGEEVRTFTVLTTEANAYMSALHHRMPVTIRPEFWDAWLDPQASEADRLAALEEGPEEGEWQAWPVSRAVNNVGNDAPELIQPLAGEASQVTPVEPPIQPELPLETQS